MLSVVIPVYNSAGYLSICMNSILDQSYRDIQIIAVDDGSTDESLEILNDYAEQDSRIVVIHQENAGAGAARNKGIVNASGEWILFVDSDDWIERNYCQNMLDAIIQLNADAVIACPRVDELMRQGLFTYEEKEKLICSCLAFDEMTFAFNIDAPWGKIFRTELMRKNEIMFPENLKRSEDAYFCMDYYYHAKKIGYLTCSGYQYQVRDNSLSKSYGMDALFTLEEVLETNLEWTQIHEDKTKQYEKAMWFRVLPGIVECEEYYFLHENNKKSMSCKLHEYKMFLKQPMINRAIKTLKIKDMQKKQYKVRLILYKLGLGNLFLRLKF